MEGWFFIKLIESVGISYSLFGEFFLPVTPKYEVGERSKVVPCYSVRSQEIARVIISEFWLVLHLIFLEESKKLQ